MPIYRPDDVQTEPVVFLKPWRIFELEDGARHLCGGVGFFGSRVSSAVVSIDYENATATTSTGRIYELIGEPGPDADADYVWQEWAAYYNVRAWDDVTEEVWSRIKSCQQA